MANTLAGSKFFIADAPQPNDLTQAEYEALTWIQVSEVGSVGELGNSTNLVSYTTLDTDVVQQAKGTTTGGTPPIEVARNQSNVGQIAMRAAADTKFQYAFKFEKDDAPDATQTNTIHYYRGVVTGPLRPNGRNEDFDLEIYTLGVNQREITVGPEAI